MDLNEIVTKLGGLLWDYKGVIGGFSAPILLSLLARLIAKYHLARGYAPNHVRGHHVYVVGTEVRVEPVENLDADIKEVLPSSSEFPHIFASARGHRHSRALPSPFLVLPEAHREKIWLPVEKIARRALGHDGMLAAKGAERAEDIVELVWLFDDDMPGEKTLVVLVILRQQLNLLNALLKSKEKLTFGSYKGSNTAEQALAEHIVRNLIPKLLEHIRRQDDVAQSRWSFLLVR